VAELLSSKVVVVEEPPQVRGIPSLSTSVAGAVGITERGPMGQAVLCTSFARFTEVFGGFTADSNLALAAMGFFGEGGSQLWVVRTAHYERPFEAQSVTARAAEGEVVARQVPTPAALYGAARGPFALSEDVELVLRVGLERTRSVHVTGVAAAVGIGATSPLQLVDGMTLQLRVDSGAVQNVVFQRQDFENIGAASVTDVARVLQAQLRGVRVTEVESGTLLESETRGRASRIDVLGGTAAPLLRLRPYREGGGTVARLEAVQPEEARLLLKSAVPEVLAQVSPQGALTLQTREVGQAAVLQLVSSSANPFGFDTLEHRGSDQGELPLVGVAARDMGSYGNRLAISAQTSTDASEPNLFDLLVLDTGVVRERWLGLSLNPSSSRYARTVVNDARAGSKWIRVVPSLLGRGVAVPTQVFALLGGDDGLDGLSDGDFLGTQPARSGLRALDRIQDLSILLVPGQATPAVHRGMLEYCEIVRSGTCFAVLDPPERMSATDIVEYVDHTAALGGSSEHGAIYWPRVEVLNPDRGVFGTDTRVVVAPSGVVAGVYARTDGARPGGVYDPPAGVERGRMLTVLGFETDEVLEETARDVVYPRRINPLTTMPGFPRYIDGARTLKGDGNFPFVSERRGVSHIARSLQAGLQFARHRNNDERLRAEVKRTVTAFLVQQMNQGAFRSRTADTAFFVDMSENTPSVIFSGRLIVRVGLATQRPAEWVVISISQDTRALDAELA
jgi:phage tail sheath protein FI